MAFRTTIFDNKIRYFRNFFRFLWPSSQILTWKFSIARFCEFHILREICLLHVIADVFVALCYILTWSAMQSLHKNICVHFSYQSRPKELLWEMTAKIGCCKICISTYFMVISWSTETSCIVCSKKIVTIIVPRRYGAFLFFLPMNLWTRFPILLDFETILTFTPDDHDPKGPIFF